jgi:hypothetical protein
MQTLCSLSVRKNSTVYALTSQRPWTLASAITERKAHCLSKAPNYVGGESEHDGARQLGFIHAVNMTQATLPNRGKHRQP